VLAQARNPSGHAVNPVPVSENRRIPEVDEIVDAQLFADRLITQAADHRPLLDPAAAEALADQLLTGGETFRERTLAGLAEAGFAIDDPMELMLALRRIGARRLEALFGPGPVEPDGDGKRRPLVPASALLELDRMAEERLACISEADRALVAGAGLRALVATTDVHEHGKGLVERVFAGLGVTPLDGGVSCDPDDLAETARQTGADLIALSTYNGVALSFMAALKQELEDRGLEIPVLIGGRLNQIPETPNTSLPVEVGDELAALGAIVCREVEDALPALVDLARTRRS
jgi:methylmalonyl-CoA mutase cobalamin-binding subunit